MDSSGVASMLAEDCCARSNGHDLSLISGSPQIQRVHEITGVDGYLRFDV